MHYDDDINNNNNNNNNSEVLVGAYIRRLDAPNDLSLTIHGPHELPVSNLLIMLYGDFLHFGCFI